MLTVMSCSKTDTTNPTDHHLTETDRVTSTVTEMTTQTNITTEEETKAETTTLKIDAGNITEIVSSTNKTETTIKQTVNNSNTPPDIFVLDIQAIKEIKNASETMSEDEFAAFMEENYSDEIMNGMDSLENTKRLLSKIESAYIAVYNSNDTGEFITIYADNMWMHQRIYLNDTLCVNFRTYTEASNAFLYEDGENFSRIKTYNLGNATVELMEGSDNGEKILCGNIIVNDKKINFYTFEFMSVSDFEEFLSELQIITIGDLLEQSDAAPEETSSKEE